MAGNPTTFSVLGADVVVTGNISSTVDLHIDGNVEGDLKCANFVQGEGSAIKGAIIAETARIAGTVEGSIEARDLVIQRSARITGDVVYQNLTIENGGKVEGKFSHRRNAGERRPETAPGKTPLELVADQPSREPSQGMAG
jgi:cytoskeletal protein CcmA (bactofilin family)